MIHLALQSQLLVIKHDDLKVWLFIQMCFKLDLGLPLIPIYLNKVDGSKKMSIKVSVYILLTLIKILNLRC